MITVGDITFLRPLWVLALPAIVLFAALSLRRSARPGDWQARIEPHLMATLTALGRVETGRSGWMTALPFVVAGLIVIALTRDLMDGGRLRAAGPDIVVVRNGNGRAIF